MGTGRKCHFSLAGKTWLVVLGGTWAPTPAVVEAVADRPVAWSRPVPVRAARIATEAPLAGARHSAVRDLRAAILTGNT